MLFTNIMRRPFNKITLFEKSPFLFFVLCNKHLGLKRKGK